jgi:multidrug efflux system outer membrane protein
VARRGCAIALAALWLGGCALTPDYERPNLAPPEAWRGAHLGGESIANLPWWELYRDPALRWLIRTALDRNRDLAIALSRVQEASHRVHFTMADQFPFIDASGSAGRGRASPAVVRGASAGAQYSVGASVSFEVDLWRKLARATEGARADLLASEATHRNVTISLVSSVASSYFLLRDLDERLAIAERTVAGRRESLRIIGARFEKGTAPELDVNQAQIELSIAEAATAAFERQVVQGENALRVLLGAYPGAIPRGPSLEERGLLPDVPVGLPSDLLERRPDVVAAEQVLAAETARIGVSEAMRFPSLTLTGSVSAVADGLSEINSNEAKAWNIAAGAFQPLWNAGQLRAQARIQHERASQALYAYVAALQVAFREVEDSLVAVRTLRDEHAARARQVVAARNAARLSRARYDAGIVDYLEVLDTERTLFNSELDESASRQQALNAVVQLYKALGGGWTAEVEDTSSASTR